MVRIYIAGPMKDVPGLNFRAFEETAKHLRSLGFDVVSPVEVGKWHFGDDTTRPSQDYLRKDIEVLLTCNSICLLPGWERSVGARCEAVIARTFSMSFRDSSGELIVAPTITVDKGYDG